MEKDTAIYQSYHAMVSEISNGLQRAGEVCKELNMIETEEGLIRSEQKMKNRKFSIGILGEFKRGKSTVINALLGREIMPSDILPTSATMNRVTYGLEPKAQILMRDGSEEIIQVEELVDYVTKLDDEKAAQAEKVEEAVVYYPCKFCRNGVDIVDTPGLNDEGRMDKIVEEVIPKLDAVIMVITPDSPFSMSEAEFVRTKLMTSDIGRLIFLINKFDLVRKRDRERVLSEIRRRIETSVMSKMKEIHGEDSDMYKTVQSKLADIRIFPISARDALDGRIEGDYELVEESGMLAFEEALGKMLTEERGALELGMPITQVLRSCDKIQEMIENCKAALDCSEAEFQEAQRKTLAECSSLRERQMEKVDELNMKAKAVKREFGAKAAECYDKIEAGAYQIIDDIALDNPKMTLTESAKRALVDQTMQKIGKMAETEMNMFSERIINELNAVVGREALHTAALVAQYDMRLAQATVVNRGVKETIGAIVLDTVATAFTADILPGIGGIITGYRAAGVKGALVGGGTAFASSLAVAVALAPLGIVGLPLSIIACAGGTLAGKAVSEKIFTESRNKKILADLKEKLRKDFEESSTQMRRNRDLESWIDDTVEGQFSILISTMNDECKRMINQANETINNVKMELVRSASEKKKRMEEYDRMLETVEEIREKLKPLQEKIAGSIDG